jgi:protein O-GlcNAc transferase
MTNEQVETSDTGSEQIDENLDESAQGKPMVIDEESMSKEDRAYYQNIVESIDLLSAGKNIESIDIAQECLRERPQSAEGFFVIGIAAMLLRDFGKAIDLFSTAHDIDPDVREYADALAHIHTLSGNLSDGLYFAKLATTMDPYQYIQPYLPPVLSNYFFALSQVGPSSHYTTALIRYNQRYYDAAASECEMELRLNPDHIENLVLYGKCLFELGRFDESVQILQRTIGQKSLTSTSLTWLGNSLRQLGLFDESIKAHMAAAELDPSLNTLSAALDNLQNFGDQFATELAETKRRLMESIDATEVYPKRSPRGEKQNPELIHVGYIVNSVYDGEFMPFFEGIIRHHDPSNFRSFVYQQSITENALHVQLKNQAHSLRPIYDMDLETLSVIMINDRLDVLVDLSGTSDGHQYALLKQDVAPLVTGALKSPFGFDIPQYNFVISDSVTSKSDKKKLHKGAKSISLKRPLYAMEPPEHIVYTSPSPAKSSGFVTFGATCDMLVLTPEVIALYAEILKSAPNSRLCLGNVPQITASVQERILDQFKFLEVGDRISFSNAGDHDLNPRIEFFDDIDVYLEGGRCPRPRSLAEALWMGVPVVTLQGNDRQSQIAASILTAAARKDWIAKSNKTFVQICVKFSDDIKNLISVRDSLRDEVKQSDLFDAQGFTRAWEAALKEAHSTLKN